MTTITRALRAAADMIEIERTAFVECQAWPDGSLRGPDAEICAQYDHVLGLLRAALEAAQREQAQDEHDAVRRLRRVDSRAIWSRNMTASELKQLRALAQAATPVGWSDTDWIKYLQEQDEQPHPLAGQHINQGSMDAAADAYEAEYNAARGIT